MARKLVLAGGLRPQMRKASPRNWTKAREREFLSALAETCNVKEAARQARVCVSYAYKKRAADARFRAGWIAAIGTAYQRLELVLLDRAFNGTEKVVKRTRPWKRLSRRAWKSRRGCRRRPARSSVRAT